MRFGFAVAMLTEEVGSVRKGRLLRLTLLLGVLFFQTILWQVAFVQMAHFHTEMKYQTAVDLLENRPLVFYSVLAIPLLVSNAAILLWSAHGRRFERRQGRGLIL